MRINQNLITSISDIPDWFQDLQDQFFAAHHIDKNCESARAFMWSSKGLSIIAEWLAQQGYDVKYWELDYTCSQSKIPIAFGFDINDACTKIVEHKLRYSGEHDS